MKTLRRIFEHFDDEIEGVVEYVGDAMTVKKTDPELSKAYLEMAAMEANHAKTLHTHACAKIDSMMADSEDIPDIVSGYFEDRKSHMLKELAKAKAYLEVYK